MAEPAVQRATFDDKNRRRYGPGTLAPSLPRKIWQVWIFPQRTGKYWNYNQAEGRTATLSELRAKVRTDSVDSAREMLALVESITRSASDRAAAADRRATTIAGAIAISASVTLGGASLVLDTSKMQNSPHARLLFAVFLLVATATFVLSAAYALRAFVATRQWSWPNPHHIDKAANQGRADRSVTDNLKELIELRAALQLKSFAGNWELSDLKNRCVDLSLRLLILALAALVALAVVVVVAVAAP